ncbi:MAG: GGDEF domain-containing protein [Acidithiobacillus sp.]|uniref:GGDEF domain-containing protein n=1 Tax=Acidithiobacillus sp. TaxID=1872118 RepID=UPI003CFFE80B
MTAVNATDIARETLHRLASRKAAPTPENYARVFEEVRVEKLGPMATEQPSPASATTSATKDTSGSEFDWAPLLKRWFREWDRDQESLTHLQKILSRDQVLKYSRNATLYYKLTALVENWEKQPTRRAPPAAASPDRVLPIDPAESWRELWRRSIFQGLAATLREDEEAIPLLQQLEAELNADLPKLDRLLQGSRQLWQRLDQLEAESAALNSALSELVHIFLRNIKGLVEDDRWLLGQMEILESSLNPPLRLQRVQTGVGNLKTLVLQQEQRQSSLGAARRALHDLMTLIFQSLESFSQDSAEAQDALAVYSQNLEHAEDWQQIRRIVTGVLETSQRLREKTAGSLQALKDAREQLRLAQNKVHELEEELATVSSLVHVDPLTNTLNRRGLAEIFRREQARAERHQQDLVVALVDLDRFKRINDRYGHDLGDRVLVAFCETFRHTLRASDSIARYGGEEFVVLLPNSTPEMARNVLQRVQEDLDRHPTQTRDGSLRVAFSAGISRWRAGMEMEDCIIEADKALYAAKSAGRRRIFLADEL